MGISRDGIEGIADSVGDLSSYTYQYAADVQEVWRYLKRHYGGRHIFREPLFET